LSQALSWNTWLRKAGSSGRRNRGRNPRSRNGSFGRWPTWNPRWANRGTFDAPSRTRKTAIRLMLWRFDNEAHRIYGVMNLACIKSATSPPVHRRYINDTHGSSRGLPTGKRAFQEHPAARAGIGSNPLYLPPGMAWRHVRTVEIRHASEVAEQCYEDGKSGPVARSRPMVSITPRAKAAVG
jgi:hypothetical protein